MKDKIVCLIFMEYPQSSGEILTFANEQVQTLYNFTLENEHPRVPFIFYGQSELWVLGTGRGLGDFVQPQMFIDKGGRSDSPGKG